MRYLILTLLILSGCGKTVIDPAFNSTLDSIDADFKIAEITADIRSVSIQFGDATQNNQNADAIGVCTKGVTGNSIIIDENAWNTYTDSFREYLLAHELGHCILNLEHDGNMVQLTPFMPDVPESIMNPHSDNAANWDSQYHDYYFSQLKNMVKAAQ